MTLPHTVAPLSWQNWDPAAWEQVWTYRKHFDAPPGTDGMRVFPDFGAAMTHLTVTDVPAGQPDNVVTMGQTILQSGSGTTLGFLGAAGSSGQDGAPGTVYYTDGSTSSFRLALPAISVPRARAARAARVRLLRRGRDHAGQGRSRP